MFYKSLKKAQLKLDKEIRHKDFMKECKQLKITPKFIKIKNKFLLENFKSDVFKFENKIIKKIIRRKYRNIKYLNNEVERLKNEHKHVTTTPIYNHDIERINKIRKYEENKHKLNLNKKLNFWISKDNGYKNQEKSSLEDKIPYINLSSTIFTDEEDKILKLGPKYILGNQMNLKDSIPRIEIALKNIPEDEASKIRNLTQNEIEKLYKTELNHKQLMQNRIIYNLKKKKDVTFLHTDKTGKIAILDKTDYIKRMEETIRQMHTEYVTKDPNTILKNKVEELIKNGKWPGNIKPIKRNFTPNTPPIYGKLKDHKTPLKIRPIVNKRISPTYDLEKYLKNIYKNIIPNSNHSISSNNEFLEKLSNFKPTNESFLMSLDVENLYPSIDINEIIEIINNEIKNKFTDPEIINTLQSSTNLILNHNYFTFNDKIYKQTKGVPMGSPISNIIADWKMRILENKIITNNKDTFKLWIRYVDDIFVIIDKNIDPLLLTNKLNTYDNNIKFTFETEKNKILPFLDIKLIRNSDIINTTVYRKPNANINITPITSKTPFPYKISIIKTYIHRALKICSTKTLLKTELAKIKNITKNAGYNTKMINKLIQKTTENFNNIKPAQKINKHANAIPFMEGISLKIKKELKKLNINLPIKPDHTIFQSLRSDTEKINPIETAGIYKISYTDINDVEGNYIGMTKRKIKDRLKEHIRDLKQHKENTALARLNCNSSIVLNQNKTTKLSNYNNLNYALTRETIEIITNKIKPCNDMLHSQIDVRWRSLLKLKRKFPP